MFTSHLLSTTQPDPKPAIADQAAQLEGAHHASAKVPPPLFATPRPLPPRATTATVDPEGLPRLSGIVISGKVGHAIFERAGQLEVSTVGDHLGVYRILDIAPMTVTVEGPQGIQTLHPDSDGANGQEVVAGASGGQQPPSLLDKLNSQPPPVVPLPRPPSLTQMLSRLPRSH